MGGDGTSHDGDGDTLAKQAPAGGRTLGAPWWAHPCRRTLRAQRAQRSALTCAVGTVEVEVDHRQGALPLVGACGPALAAACIQAMICMQTSQ